MNKLFLSILPVLLSLQDWNYLNKVIAYYRLLYFCFLNNLFSIASLSTPDFYLSRILIKYYIYSNVIFSNLRELLILDILIDSIFDIILSILSLLNFYNTLPNFNPCTLFTIIILTSSTVGILNFNKQSI